MACLEKVNAEGVLSVLLFWARAMLGGGDNEWIRGIGINRGPETRVWNV